MKKPNISADSFAPVFQWIEQLTKIQRIIIFVLTIVLLVGSFAWFSYRPKLNKISQLKEDYKSLSKKLAVAKKKAQQLPQFKARFKKAETQFKIAMKALPEKKEIPTLLAGISQAGQDAGLDFLLFQPKPIRRRDFYAEIPVAIKVVGNYHNVALFFDSLAILPRIVNINNITMAKSKKGSKLTTSCTAVTYQFVEPRPKKKKKRTPRKRKRRT
ncbi:MAG: type 4a pilus biogenesis protein PilO [Desulfobacterales bacterium]|nr:type 4a pilus biogenesis protein PilO [Desulfobacterales bacterium]